MLTEKFNLNYLERFLTKPLENKIYSSIEIPQLEIQSKNN
jgi:hypothetical protein